MQQLCRLCGSELRRTFVDLGLAPPCQYAPTAEQIDQGEMFYPLNVRICDECLLVQLPAYIDEKANFTEYAYFSSFSSSWVEHARQHVNNTIERFGLSTESFVMEVASNDGYLLQHVKAAGIRCLGVEPAANVAQVAIDNGIPTAVEFLGESTAEAIRHEHGPANVVFANNVLGHVPHLADFVKGVRTLLSDVGYFINEIPHLQKLIENRLYDTIYHEHFQYYTLLTTQRVLAAAGLKVVDVEEISTHGGSLRTWSTPVENDVPVSERVDAVLRREEELKLNTMEGFLGFQDVVSQARNDILEFLIRCSREGKSVVAYGVAGKGNTLLNHCGVRSDLVHYAVDKNPYKVNKFMPGSHIPTFPVTKLEETKPDYIMILPWNLRDEIAAQLEYTRAWGAKLVVPLPKIDIW